MVKKIVIIILIIIAVIVSVKILLETDEDKIKKLFYAFSELMEKEPDETNLIMAKKARRIGALVTNPFTITIPEYAISGEYTRQEISQRATMGRLRFTELTLELFDLSIKVIDDVSAETEVTVRAIGKGDSGETFEGIHELACWLKKTEDEWLFHRVEVVDVLEK